MSFGYSINSDDGNLLVSSNALNLHYLGFADRGSSGMGHGFSTYYTINSTSRPLVFATLGVGDAGCIVDVTEISSGVWRIETLGDPNPACFAALTTEGPRDTYGLRIYKSNGQVSFDSTRCPLFLKKVITQQYPAGTPLSSMKVPYPAGVTSPWVTAYACAIAEGPQPPLDVNGHPIGTAGFFMLGIEDVGDGWAPAWFQERAGDTGFPASVLPHAVNFTILVAESTGIQ